MKSTKRMTQSIEHTFVWWLGLLVLAVTMSLVALVAPVLGL